MNRFQNSCGCADRCPPPCPAPFPPPPFPPQYVLGPTGPQGVQATFDWQAARDSVVGRMCTATLINDIEVY